MAYISITSDLKRKSWMRQGLIQAASKSFWSPYTGTNVSGQGGPIVQQVNNMNADTGHTVVFDYDGNLAGKAIKGKDTAFGKGEDKRKFSNKIAVERYRLVADNGDAFDAVDVGDLSLSQHEDSRAKLGDLFVRFKDQALFDCVQGVKGSTPTTIINVDETFDYNTLLTIENKIKNGGPFDTGSTRRPLVPYQLADGKPVWIFLVDSAMAYKLKTSSGYQAMIYNADVRGNDNRAINGVIGKIGQLLVVEADTFFGVTDSAATTFGLETNSVEIAGLRKQDTNGLWTGQTGYLSTGDQISRGAVLGANAIQLAFGKMPDYKFKSSQDFDIKSESALEVWMECQKTILTAELGGDYTAAKVAGTDWGIINVDCETTAS